MEWNGLDWTGLEWTTHMNLVHDGLELPVLGTQAVDGRHGCVEVLDVLGVHLEEGRVPHHHVTDPLELRALGPAGHAALQLGSRVCYGR